MLWSRCVIVSFALASAGCELAQNYLDPEGPRYSGDYSDDPTAAAALPQVSIVTFNIEYAMSYEQAGDELASHPQLSTADIVLLQEMDAPSTDAIARRLRMAYVYYPGSVQDNGRDFGNAVLSRWPIVSDQKVILPHKNPTDGRIRIAVQATLASPLGEISAYSVHNETPWLGPRARLEQAGAIVKHARSSELASIAGGDFNTSDPGSEEETVTLFDAAGFAWASQGSGTTAGSFTLDHIFVKRLVPMRAGTADTKASDHRPEWARVELDIGP
jgi:endonuclease/exonuclease/phosphatase family metal-dependent hydrolase